MAPTPTTIPTSFVPKQPVRSTQRFSKSGGNIFLIVSVVILAISLVSAGGVFALEQYLTGITASKKAAVDAAEEKISTTSVEDFIRTRDRLIMSQQLLDGHVVASQFFDLLESITLQTVRFDTLSFTLVEDRTAEIRMEGVARTFNALAAQSSALTGEKQVKRAIFSDIRVDEEDDTVAFSLSADLAASLLSLTVEDAPTPLPEEPAPVEAGVDTGEPIPSGAEVEVPSTMPPAGAPPTMP